MTVLYLGERAEDGGKAEWGACGGKAKETYELKTRERKMAPVEPGGAGGSSQQWKKKAYGVVHFSRK